MPIQPINYAAIPTLRGPFQGIDFGDLLKQGMQLRHEPQRLLAQREQEQLANALQRENLQQTQALTPYAAENARNASIENKIRAQFAHPNAQANLEQLINSGKLTGEQAKYFGRTALANMGLTEANTALANRSAALPWSQGMDISNPIQAHNAYRQFQAEHPNEPELVKDVGEKISRYQQLQEDKKLPQQQQKLMQIRRLYEQRDNPNTDPGTRKHLDREIAQHENQLEKEALGSVMYTRLNQGKEMQQAIDAAMKPRYKGKNKEGKDIWGNSPIDDATMFSGPFAWTAKAKEAALGKDDYRRYKAGQDALKKIMHLYTKFEGLSVSNVASQNLMKLFRGEDKFLSPDAANQNLRQFLDTITRGHQGVADKAREDAGLPLREIDVHGKRRFSSEREINPQSNMETVRNQQTQYRGNNSKNQPRDLYFNGSDFQEGGF